ncbi:hypothetical protein J6Z48_03155, partial [bacterium]|nr:hypothetical protein [bacterium]
SAFFIWKKNNGNGEDVKGTTTQTNNDEEESEERKKQQGIAESIFKSYLENQVDLAEYEIMYVKLDPEEKRSSSTEFFNASKDAIFAEAKFSVRPIEMTDSQWLAGNGMQDGEWIRDNTLKFYLDLNDYNHYIIKSMGTGW